MGVTTTDLYRSGNSRGPYLSRLRLADTHPDEPDVETESDASGNVSVKANSGGVSVWEAPDNNWSKVWMLPAGSSYLPGLLVWCDSAPHWLISPDGDMPLSTFVAALDVLASGFVRVR